MLHLRKPLKQHVVPAEFATPIMTRQLYRQTTRKFELQTVGVGTHTRHVYNLPRAALRRIALKRAARSWKMHRTQFIEENSK